MLFSTQNFVVAENKSDEEFKAGEVIIEHVLDSYDWHLFTWKGHHVGINLPIIVINEGRIYSFSTKRLHDSATYVTTDKKTGETITFTIPHEGQYKGKVVILGADGSQKRPLDISITKNVMALFISCTLIIVLFYLVMKAYQKRGEKAPKGLQSLIEWLIVYVRDDIARKAISEK